MKIINPFIHISINLKVFKNISQLIEEYSTFLVISSLSLVSVYVFAYYFNNRLGVAYNDARSHLDIGRRVVEGLKPGLAQLGSVWLPLPHALMIPTIWNDFMWHSGLAGAIVSMISFVSTGVIIYMFLKKNDVGILGRTFAVVVFAVNLNILYLQSTAMTELLLIATMTAGSYYLMLWAKTDEFMNLVKSAFFILLSSLTRYDGWFLFLFAELLIVAVILVKGNIIKNRDNISKLYQKTKGKVIMFATLSGFGIALWFLWNLLIFKDPFYFVFGPFSAHTQQQQLLEAGELDSKYNLVLSTKLYLYALVYNSYIYTALLGLFGFMAVWISKIKKEVKIMFLSLLAPLFFNIIALFLGHSVLFVQGISGNTWFNVRYGIMLLPAIAIFCGFLVDRLKDLRWILIGLFAFTTFFAFASGDAVTIDDARFGSSQKNVTEVSSWLFNNTKEKEGFVLISAASHDAIIFSSGLPMKKFIHEGTGLYWESAIASPERWARWIVMRTYDDNDSVWKKVSRTEGFQNYTLVETYPFASIYELKNEYINNLITTPVFGKQK